MVAVASSSGSHGRGSTPYRYSTASDSAPITNVCSHSTLASDSASSGSTSSTRAPEWATMYLTSSATRRKLIGTSTRPEPDTPKNEVSRRAEFWLTTATRSAIPIPRASSPAAWARARAAISA